MIKVHASRKYLVIPEKYTEFAASHVMPVIGPAAELHVARLLVKGEPLHIDLARGLVDGRRLPHNFAGVLHACLCHQGHFVLAVGAEIEIVLA